MRFLVVLVAALLCAFQAHAQAQERERWIYSYASCANCCSSGEGTHLYISQVVQVTNATRASFVGRFFEAVQAEYPEGDPNGNFSAEYDSQSKAEAARQQAIERYSRKIPPLPDPQIHEIKM